MQEGTLQEFEDFSFWNSHCVLHITSPKPAYFQGFIEK